MSFLIMLFVKQNNRTMKRIFKKPKDKILNTGVRTSFVNLKDDVFRVQVITPYMFNDVINEPIVDLQECSRCNVK